MVIPQISRSGRRAVGATLAAACLLAVTACADDSNAPDDTAPGTLADGEQTDLPDSSLDVSDGSGEGGIRGSEGDEAPGAPVP
jgi:hypothetical protein